MTSATPHKSGFLKQLFKKNKGEFQSDVMEVHEQQHHQEILFDYYKSLAMNHPDLILVVSPEGQILSQNNSSINTLLGFPARKKLQFSKLVTEKVYHTLRKAFYNAIQGKTERHEVEVEDKFGDALELVLTFIPIKGAEGNIAGTYIIVQDITLQKKDCQSTGIK